MGIWWFHVTGLTGPSLQRRLSSKPNSSRTTAVQTPQSTPHPRSAHLAGTQAGGKPGLPAVHQHRAHLRRAGGRGPPHEGQDGEGVLGDAHVRPLRVVVLDHHPLVLTALGVPLLTLEKGEHGQLYTECERSGNSPPGLVRPRLLLQARLFPLCGISCCKWRHFPSWTRSTRHRFEGRMV